MIGRPLSAYYFQSHSKLTGLLLVWDTALGWTWFSNVPYSEPTSHRNERWIIVTLLCNTPAADWVLPVLRSLRLFRTHFPKFRSLKKHQQSYESGFYQVKLIIVTCLTRANINMLTTGQTLFSDRIKWIQVLWKRDSHNETLLGTQQISGLSQY